MKSERFADIYLTNDRMKTAINIKQLKFYPWVTLAYLVLQFCADLSNHVASISAKTVNNIWDVSFVVVINYFLFEYTLPRLSWKRIFVSLLLLLIHIFLYSWGLYIWMYVGVGLHLYTLFVPFPSVSRAVAIQMGYSVGTIFFFGIARHIYNYIKLKQTTQQLLIQKQQAELNYLKSQTNPHFLFNTLNNIYSLARDKSDLAPESILRLSKILRFMLYETGGEYIAIEQELKILSDYISLEKLRYDDSLRVNFNYDVEDMKQALPPLLLIPLVENAFKHGVSETRSRPFVDIHVSVHNRQLNLSVKNSSEALTGERALPTGQAGVKENIGLSNLRRQLELLYTDYDLSVQQNESVFVATLKINLASHV
jgi:two-component system LytT family sensor kinase